MTVRIVDPLDKLSSAVAKLATAVRFYGTPDAATAADLPTIRAAVREGLPFPVWTGASDRTIFATPALNVANRAWHDATHVALGTGFEPGAELATVRVQCAQLRALGGDELARLYWADGAGQQEHYYRFGAFPRDQRAFCFDYCARGQLGPRSF